MERRLIAEYRAVVEALLPRLTAANVSAAAEVASYPEDIRGYGHVTDASLPKAEARRDAALKALDTPAAAAA